MILWLYKNYRILLYIMDLENITNEDLIEMENMSPQPLTHDELYFIETSE